ncbi:hypothetical protein [Streptomyces sp. NPDC050704]|uniref:hypothetical protein n=1 Tax=Streptomyces sp. NPDC050704 TaxID=3157219 RepID=UPI00342E7C56
MRPHVAGRVALTTLVAAVALTAPTPALADSGTRAADGTRVTDAGTRVAQDEPGRYLVDGARIHTRADPSSTTVGYGYTSHDVTVHCRVVVNEEEWFRHTDTTTGVTGFSRYDVLVPWVAVPDC